MSSCKENVLDKQCYLPDDKIIEYIGEQQTVAEIKKRFPCIDGIVKTKIKLKDGGYVCYVPHRPHGKSRLFPANYLCIKIKKTGILYALPKSALFGKSNKLFRITNPKISYTKDEIIVILSHEPYLSHLSLQQIQNLYDDLVLRYKKDKQGEKNTGLTNEIMIKYRNKKSPLTRDHITDVCSVIYVLTNKKQKLFTENAEKEGVCVVSENLLDYVLNFIKRNDE